MKCAKRRFHLFHLMRHPQRVSEGDGDGDRVVNGDDVDYKDINNDDNGGNLTQACFFRCTKIVSIFFTSTDADRKGKIV